MPGQIKTAEEIKIIRTGGKRLAAILDEVLSHAKPGVTTYELDQLAETLIIKSGGRPAFKHFQSRESEPPFPSTICASVNQQLVHTPASDYVLQAGDILTVDIGMRYPAVGGSVTLTLDCTDGTDSTSDSVTINIVEPSPVVVTADIKANGSDGPVTITSGDSWNYTWTSSNATSCQLTSPSGVSGVSLSGSDGPIAPSHPWYPSTSTPTTLTLNCTDGTTTATDAVVINVVAPSSCPLPSITSSLTASVTVNQPFSYTITATSTGGATTTVFSVGSLPAGLSFSTSTAAISLCWMPICRIIDCICLGLTPGNIFTPDSAKE